MKKCPINCFKVARPELCKIHSNQFNSQLIIKELTDRVEFLIKSGTHKNLVRYLDFNKKMSLNGDMLIVHLVQEDIQGVSIEQLCEDNQSINVAGIGKAVLQALSFLHGLGPGIAHGYLNLKSIFLDESAACRVADFDLIPYLMYLNGTQHLHEVNDIEKLGMLIKSLRNNVIDSVECFINQCSSGRVLNHNKLLNHPFLSNEWYKDVNGIKKYTHQSKKQLEHFEIEKKLGYGSFGTVLQAKDNYDNSRYAMKIVEITSNEKENEQIQREASIVANMNHKNIVKYVRSWVQTVDRGELKKYDSEESIRSIESDESAASSA